MRSLLLLLFVLLSATAPLSGQAVDVPRSLAPARDGLAFVGHNGANPAHAMDVVVRGDRAYVLVGWNGGLETYDISNLTSPVRLSVLGPAAWNGRYFGNALYVFSRDAGFAAYDIAGSTPQRLGGDNPSDPNMVHENGILDGTTLYVAAHQNGVQIYDVANPASPSLVGAVSPAESACWDAALSGGHLFVANGRFGLSVVDLAGAPVEIASLDLPGLCNHIMIDGTVAVVSLGGDGIATIDIADPAKPKLLDRAATRGNAFGFGMEKGKVAVGAWSILEVFDVSAPQQIRKVAFDETKTWAMGADIVPLGNKSLVVVADWRGMSTYLLENDAGPDIEVGPRDLDFGRVKGTKTEKVAVRNRGDAPLNVAVAHVPGSFQVSPLSFTVAPGLSQQVTITTIGDGIVSDRITYQSNDADEPSVTQFVYKNNVTFTQTGGAAQPFTLQDLDGYWHDLSDYRGKVIFLEFGELW